MGLYSLRNIQHAMQHRQIHVKQVERKDMVACGSHRDRKGISERWFAELGPKCRSVLSPSVDQDMLGRNSERTFWAEHHLIKKPEIGE